MPRPALWLLSLLAFLVLCVICVSRHASAIEADVEARTRAVLSASEYRGAAELAFSGRDVTVRAEDPALAERVAERVRGIEGVRTATVAGPLAPLPDVALDGPFALTPLASGALALRGAVPDSATRDRLMGAAQMAFPDRRIRDGLTLDSTAPGDWAGDVASALSRLKTVQNPGLSVDASGALVLTGTVDGEGSRRNVESRVTSVVSPRAVDNRLALAGTAPAPEAQPDVASGETPGTETDATPEPAAERPAPEAAPSGQVEVQNALSQDADAQALERVLRQRLGRGAVTFEAGTDRLTPGSAEVLRRAADALKAQPGIAIELQAHTDSEGPTRPNQRLSEARARAAKRVLVDAGVTPDQLLAAGYGESTPIASNSTEAGRAQNRRVVFKLLRRR